MTALGIALLLAAAASMVASFSKGIRWATLQREYAVETRPLIRARIGIEIGQAREAQGRYEFAGLVAGIPGAVCTILGALF